MDNMPGGVNLQKQIASIMDVLAKAAVAEISKVVEDGVVLLRLEMCERENEIDTLKRNLQAVSEELRAARRALVRECVSVHPRLSGASQRAQGVKEKDKRGTERESGNEDLNGPREEINMASGVKVKIEIVEDGEEMAQETNQNTKSGLISHSDSTDNEQLWSPEENPDMHSPEYFHPTHDQLQHQSDPAVTMETSYGPLEDRLETSCPNGDVPRQSEHSRDSLHVTTDELLRAQNSTVLQQTHSNAHNPIIHPLAEGQANFSVLGVPARGRLMNGGMDLDKRRFPCMFCGKCFDRISHVERHQRIHTGEKPFSCRLCGRRFSQKCSLKSHLKTHRGINGVRDAASGLSSDDNHFSNDWSMAPHCEEQIAHHSYINGQDMNTMNTEEQNSQLCQENNHFINTEEERLDQPHVDHQTTLINPNHSPAGGNKCTDLHDDFVVGVQEDSIKTEQKEEDKSEMLKEPLTEFRQEEPKCTNTGSESVMEEEVLGLNSASIAEESTEYSSNQSKCKFKNTSTILHSWEAPAVANTRSFESNDVHVKEEKEDKSPVEEEETHQKTKASPIDQNLSAGTFGTIDALMVPDLPSNPLPQRLISLKGVPRRRERRFPCVLCGKRFDRLSHLERHQRIHTGEKPYSCGMCGRRFTQKSSLTGHIRTHTRERAYHCSDCGMSFPTRAGRYRHSCNQTETGYLR